MSVTSELEEALAHQDPPGLGRTITIGAVIGTVLSFAGTTAGMIASGEEVMAAVGLGTFVGFWGGLGFGSMLGGAAWAIRATEGSHPDGPTKWAEP